MKIAITLICHNRPDYLRRVLESIQMNVYHGMSLIVVRDNATKEVCEIIEGIDWIHKIVRDTNLGVNYANRHAYRMATLEGADYVVAVEDDTVLAPDCLQLARWFSETDSALMNCFSHSKSLAQPEAVRPLIRFCPWVWSFRTKFFWDVLQPYWMRDQQGWDWSMQAAIQRFGIYALEPVLSRSKNIGRDGGVHYTREQFDAHFTNHVMSDGSKTEFKLCG